MVIVREEAETLRHLLSQKTNREALMSCSILIHLLLSSFLLLTFFLEPVHARKKCYIVYLGSHSHGPTPSLADLEFATNSHYDLLGSILGSHEKAKEAIIYSYNKHINGFAALLEEEDAAEIAKKPNVVSVFTTKEHKLHTTRSWEFLGMQRNGKNSAWQKGRYGENTIIGNIDTGVWPESDSFSDEGIGPIPSRWRGGGVCQINKLNGSKKVPCNRRLIGARIFNKAYEAYHGELHPSEQTARDFVGHGTHTLSIAGGNFVENAHVFGNGNGTAKGGSPRARVAAYKVCWSPRDASSCFGADVLSAIDQAISDGADVLSISVGGRNSHKPEEIFTDEVSIGAFHALAKNIVVVCSAGNEGPNAGTVVNVAPWVFTVAASTIDRDFTSTITLGNNAQFKGASLFVKLPPKKSFPLIFAADAKLPNATVKDAELCKAGTLDHAKVKGKIVDCIRGGKINSVAEGQEALSAGAVGMILNNDDQKGNTVLAEPHVLSTANTPNVVNKKYIHDHYNNTKHPQVRMSRAKTYFGRKPAPVMASFSSRGPNMIQPSILKPDVTAPGVNILAAFSNAASASDLKTDTRRGFPFNVLQGTSMSCPHVAGVAGLLKTIHPNWSSAAIKSAIMTTGTTRDNTNKPIQDAFDGKLATPLDYGSGHIQPNLALDPGLIYDLCIVDYLNFLCASGYDQQLIMALNFNKPYACPRSYGIKDLNYPSITLPHLRGKTVNVTRTVTNVGSPSTYHANAYVPKGLNIVVIPNCLTFTRIGERKSFMVILQVTRVLRVASYHFGELRWTDGKHIVKSPIAVKN